MGYNHPDELLDDLTESQFSEWQAYYALEPFGEERADLRMARIVWAILQPHMKGKELDERKFLFQFGPQRKQTWEERKRAAMRYVASRKGKIQKG